MWILYFLFIAGLQNKIVSHDCDDHLRNLESVDSRNSNQNFHSFTGISFRAAFTCHNHIHYMYNFSDIVKITGITFRRDPRDECVPTFSLCYSLNGIDFAAYKAENGITKVFRSKTNESSTSSIGHNFNVPIVARHILINPRHERNDIFTKIDFYGCNYVEAPYYFNGSSLVKWDLKHTPIKSNIDSMKFRFKTFETNGIVMYGTGVQNDRFALVLADSSLFLVINLGTDQALRLSAGSVLDDGAWHDVVIYREGTNVTFSVDRVPVSDFIPGDFNSLNLDQVLYIGGVPRKPVDLKTFRNFSGCIDDLHINWIDANDLMQKSNIRSGCQNFDFTPVTFLSRKSFMKFVGLDRKPRYSATFEFRTYEESGLLLYHEFSNQGYLKMFLKGSKLWTHLLTESSQLIAIQNYEENFSDGRWHYVDISLRANNLTTVVDGNPVVTIRLISIISGAYTFIGGSNVQNIVGFIGCMRKLSINNYFKYPGDLQPNEEVCCQNDIVFNFCQMVDRCRPNPCEHGGLCHQTAADFFCDCTNTGYGGALCHKALLPLNCHAYGLRNKIERSATIQIDIDGSGPLSGFLVTCHFDVRGEIITALHHENEATTIVDGFQDAGSYELTIIYLANDDQIVALTKQSTQCRQNIRYECFRSRLFNSPSLEGNFNPFSWWVSHHNQKMDFWGGAVEGSRKCQCGIMERCKNATKWCNCDASYYEWRSDGGDIVGKEYLPVKQLRFGDTGSLLDDKQGKHTLGPLYCEGNEIFSNVITLRKNDVSIYLPAPKLGDTFDLYFEFRTGQSNGLIVECVGQMDKLMISLGDGNTIRFVYEVDGDRFDVFGLHSSSLSNNDWHTVYIEVNRKEILVDIDGNEKKQVRNRNELPVQIELSSPLSIGGSIDSSNSNGFVGCLRAFLINGELIDLASYVRQYPYGLSLGCVGKCTSNPCLNNGTCIDYYDGYACDCRWTSFKGPICADEIGATFDGQNGVIYEFPSSQLSTISESIRVGFSTIHPQGFLLGLYSSVSKEYMTISITHSGHIRVIFDFGFERQEIIYSRKDFDTGQFHDLRISRSNSGSILRIQVDGHEPMETHFNVKISTDVQFDNVQYLYIGRNETTDEGFVGCVSRVEFNDIYPLKLLFQQSPPRNIESLGYVSEDFCGVEPVTHRPEPPEIKPSPSVHVTVDDNTLKIVGTWFGLLLSFIVLAFFLAKYTANRRAFYHTQEQTGAELASDADNAVIHSKTGHVVFKKREWFI